MGSMEKGKKVMYTVLNKALYGTIQALLLFWKKISTFLSDVDGFACNPYDWCVINKVIPGKQFTIVWYVDDLKLSHVDASVVDAVLELLKKEFGQQMELTVRRGKMHDYLGFQFDFLTDKKVTMTMNDFIQELIKECPDNLMKGTSTTPAPAHLFAVDRDCEKPKDDERVIFHHLTAKILYLAKKTRPDLLTAVSSCRHACWHLTKMIGRSWVDAYVI